MTFQQLLNQCKSEFELQGEKYWLVERYSGLILENHTKIRDIFPYRKGFPPPALLIKEMQEEVAFSKRQRQVSSLFTLQSFIRKLYML